MKVIHLTPGPIFSAGANIGALQLHIALLDQSSLTSIFLSINNTPSHPHINCETYSDPFVLHPLSKLISFLDSVPFRLRNERFRWGFSGSLCLIFHLLRDQECILHFHNIPSTLNLLFLYILPNPKVFTVRDHWMFTGGCRITNDYNCIRYMSGCSNCPAVRRNPFLQCLVHFCFKLKRRILLNKNSHIVFNTRSSIVHLLGGDSSSKLRANSSIIGNIIDTAVFKPDLRRKHELRKRHSIRENDLVILAGAADLSDPNKGFHYLSKALSQLTLPSVHFCYFGAQLSRDLTSSIKLPLHHLGLSTTFSQTSDFYKISDLFVMPSIHETFGKTLAEAMSSALLCIGFKVPGTSDLIHHNQTGYLVPAFSIEGLVETLLSCIYTYNSEWNSLMRSNSRSSISSRFGPSAISTQYASVYNRVAN
jgi:glycosyltransferase involved in cell wall biosynthesis